jgi:niacin transporter
MMFFGGSVVAKMNVKEMFNTRKLVHAALLVSLGMNLPWAFHTIPNAGSIFLPMHITVLLCGILCGLPLGLIGGILTPLLSSLLTEMPPMVFLPSMLFELATYGAIAALMWRFIPIKNFYARIYSTLIVAMLSGRVVFGILNALFFQVGNYSAKIWLTAAFVTSWPGILIQVIVIPAILIALQRAKLFNFNIEQKKEIENMEITEQSDVLSPK